MATDPLSVISLDAAKASLGLPSTVTSRDSTLRSQIASAVNFVQQRSGLPLVRTNQRWRTRMPSGTEPLVLPWTHVRSVLSIAYWTPGDDPSGPRDPSGGIDVATLGELRGFSGFEFDGAEVNGPDGGWPETHPDDNRVIVQFDRELDPIPASLVECVRLAVWDFFESQRGVPSRSTIDVLLAPFARSDAAQARARLELGA